MMSFLRTLAYFTSRSKTQEHSLRFYLSDSWIRLVLSTLLFPFVCLQIAKIFPVIFWITKKHYLIPSNFDSKYYSIIAFPGVPFSDQNKILLIYLLVLEKGVYNYMTEYYIQILLVTTIAFSTRCA